MSLRFSLMFFSHLTELPLTITLTAGYPARLYGVLVAVNGLLIALFEMSVVERLRPFRRLRVAALGTFLTGLAFSSAGLFRHWTWFLLVVVGYTAGEILTTPQKMAFVTDWAPPSSRGRYLSYYQATWSIAMGLNPILFLPLRTRLGDAAFWPLMMLLAAPSALLLLRLDRVADRPGEVTGGDGRAAPAGGAGGGTRILGSTDRGAPRPADRRARRRRAAAAISRGGLQGGSRTPIWRGVSAPPALGKKLDFSERPHAALLRGAS